MMSNPRKELLRTFVRFSARISGSVAAFGFAAHEVSQRSFKVLHPIPARIFVEPEKVIVIGRSAGALDCLQSIVDGLPADIPAAILVTLRPFGSDSQISQLLPDVPPTGGVSTRAPCRFSPFCRAGLIFPKAISSEFALGSALTQFVPGRRSQWLRSSAC